MRLNEVTFNGALPVNGYGPGFFRVGGNVMQGDICVLPGGPVPWGGYGDMVALLGAAGDLDVLFVGTGNEISHVPEDFRAALEDAGLGVETMASPAACRAYNVLLGEGRRVGLALFAI